jgi:integrase
MAAEENPDLAMFVLLAAATGVRRSELIALRWSDIDLDGKKLKISRGLV